jgi:hypothetical protein
MKILVFLHGTVLMHRGALGKSREERVRQVAVGEVTVRDFASYVPAEGAVRKLTAWQAQAAEIHYLSSHRNDADVDTDCSVLKRYGFPDGLVHHCAAGESYADVAARLLPDVLIEDDCESIGGEPEMTYPHLPTDLKKAIKSIVVQEFGGIDHLPDSIYELAAGCGPT